VVWLDRSYLGGGSPAIQYVLTFLYYRIELLNSQPKAFSIPEKLLKTASACSTFDFYFFFLEVGRFLGFTRNSFEKKQILAYCFSKALCINEKKMFLTDRARKISSRSFRRFGGFMKIIIILNGHNRNNE
jgi:hypothetical protein